MGGFELELLRQAEILLTDSGEFKKDGRLSTYPGKDKFLAVLRRRHGVVTNVARDFKVTPHTIYAWIETNGHEGDLEESRLAAGILAKSTASQLSAVRAALPSIIFPST